MSQRLEILPGHTTVLPPRAALPPRVHVFDAPSIQAVNAALAARRPLLVRGEPGTGKSQLAEAAAMALGRAFVSKVVDARTESRDLLWSFDAVERLALAQVLGALKDMDEGRLKDELKESRFLRPGPLWWAFDWSGACAFGPAPSVTPNGWAQDQGTVVLLDEIDKADSDVPNGLLEALGNGMFAPPGFTEPVMIRGGRPLVVVTTNEERALPDAFLRRCLVLHLDLPEGRDALGDLLLERGRAHFPSAASAVLRKAVELLLEDRSAVRERGLVPPGQAEYLDLVRAVVELGNDESTQLELLDALAGFTYRKHPREPA